MPVPSPRNSIRIARGNYADLAANATEIGEGELCFAIDQDKFYSKSGGSLVAVGGGTELYSIQQLGDVDVTGAANGQALVYDASEGKWVPADQSGSGEVDSVNGQTGVVVLNAADVGAATAAQGVTADSAVQPGDLATVATSGSYNDLTDKPTIVPPPIPPVDSVNGQTGDVILTASDVGALASGDNISELTNNAGYITSAEAPVQPGDVFSGDYNDLTNKPTIPPAYDDTALAARVTTNEGDISQLQTDVGNIDTFSGDYNDLTNKPSIPPAFDGGVVSTSITSPEETITAGAWDLSAGNFWTAGAITVPNPTNAVSGMSGLIRLTAAPTGWGANIKHPGGSAETIANFPAMVPFYVQDASTILLGKATQGIA